MPKTISRILRLNHGTVRSELRRLLDSENTPVIRSRRGWYRHRLDMDSLPRAIGGTRLELHGIKLEGQCHEENAGYSLAHNAKMRYRRRGTYREVFEDRMVTVTVHEKGLVEVFLKTSETPMCFPQFDRFQAWLKGLLDVVSPSTWKVRQLGINADTCNLNLDGVSSIRLTAFRNAWFQIYQKGKDVVRFETHLFTDLKLEEALMLMRQLLEPRASPFSGSYQPSPLDPMDHSVV